MNRDGPIPPAGPHHRSTHAGHGSSASASNRPSLSTGTVTGGFVVAAILLAATVPLYNALIRPWPNAVYSVSDDGMTISLNGVIGPGDGGPFALRVASALTRMWLTDDDRPLVVELNSDGGGTGAAEMMAYSLLLVNRLTQQGTVTVVGQDSVCYSACTFVFGAGSRRIADPSAVFMFHQPHTQAIPSLPQRLPQDDSVKFADWLTGSTLSWVSFRSPALAGFLVDNGFYRYRDCYLRADQISSNFPGYFTGDAAPGRKFLTMMREDDLDAFIVGSKVPADSLPQNGLP
jgi:hypothetical protein